MEYFKDLQANVIYCDSSPEKYEGVLYGNVKYLHLPSKNFAEKISIVLTEINTDFVAMCADDDFIIIDSLYKGYDFLSQNMSYKCVVGKYIGFNDDFDGRFFPIYQELPEDINLGFDKNAEVFFKNYYQILWAMYDKKIIDKVYQIINQAKFHNDNFIELTIGTYACYVGGIKFINEIWGVREINKHEHWGNRHEPILNIRIAETNNDFKKFKEFVDSNTFVGCAELAMNSYLNGHIKTAVSFRNTIGRIIPEFIKKEIRNWGFLQNSKSIICSDQFSKRYLSPILRILIKDTLSNN